MAIVKQSIEQNFVDLTTGEIIRSEEKISKNWGSEPPFIKLYLQDILYLKDLPKAHNSVLLALLKRASWANEGMEISLTAGTKRLMLKELNLKNIRTINNALSDFVKTEILYRIETGVYRFNPYLFGKGDWQDISKLRLTIDYSLNGKTFGSVIAYNESLPKSAETAQNVFNSNNISEYLKNTKNPQNEPEAVLKQNKEFSQEEFLKLHPKKLTTIKNKIFWIINNDNQNQVYVKKGRLYVPFLSTNPDEELHKDINFALENYEDTEAKSLF